MKPAEVFEWRRKGRGGNEKGKLQQRAKRGEKERGEKKKAQRGRI